MEVASPAPAAPAAATTFSYSEYKKSKEYKKLSDWLDLRIQFEARSSSGKWAMYKSYRTYAENEIATLKKQLKKLQEKS